MDLWQSLGLGSGSPRTPALFWCAFLPESHIETERPSVTAVAELPSGLLPLAVFAPLHSGSGARLTRALPLPDARPGELHFLKAKQQSISAYRAPRSAWAVLARRQCARFRCADPPRVRVFCWLTLGGKSTCAAVELGGRANSDHHRQLSRTDMRGPSKARM